MKPKFYIAKLLLLAVFITQCGNIFSQTFQDNRWRPNGPVNAMLKNGNTIYLGGNFSYIGPDARNGVPVELSSGAADLDFPMPDGTVNTAVPDGSGGWYVGGSFTKVGDSIRHNLARINANGTVNTWNPKVNGQVYCMVLNGGTLYVGGNFYKVGDSTRSEIAAVNVSNGRATSWKPWITGSGALVRTLLLDGTIIYAGGSFNTVSGKVRNNITALGLVSDTALNFNPNASSEVYSLVKNGTKLIAGGNFTQIGGQPRSYVGEVLLSNGTATSWNPTANGIVNAVAVSGNKVFIGGSFTTVSTIARNRLAAIDLATGGLLDWNPGANSTVKVLMMEGTSLFAAGTFTGIAGQSRSGVAELDTATGAVTSWEANTDGGVSAICTDGTNMYVGGSFKSIGGVNRLYFAAIDATTGNPTSLNVVFDNPVNALALSGTTLYAGGDFTFVNGLGRKRLASINTTNGAVNSWNPGADKKVRALAVKDTIVYAGGDFDTLNNVYRRRLGAINASNGVVNTWTPNPNGYVYALTADANAIYVGGDFSSIAALSRSRVAAFNTSTGAILSWNANANGRVSALTITNSKIYVGGSFSYIGGQSRSGIAALDSATATVLSWNPQVNGTVSAIAVGNSYVCAGGSFSAAKGYSRWNLAAFDTSTGHPLAWSPNPTSSVNALVINGTDLTAGGNFIYAGGLANYYNASNNGEKSRRYLITLSLNTNTQVEDIKRELAFCPGDTVTIAYTTTGIYNAGNVFTLQMSNGSGSFASPVNVGSLTSTTYGNMLATIPANTPDGNNYRFRIVSSNPVVTGTMFAYSMEIKSSFIPFVDAGSPYSLCPASETSIWFYGQYVGAHPVYTLRINGSVVQTGSETYYSYTPSHLDKVALTLESSLSCAVPDSAINRDTIRVYTNNLTVNAGADRTVSYGGNTSLNPVITGITPGGGSTSVYYDWNSYSSHYVSASLNNPYILNPVASGLVTSGYLVLQVTDSATGCYKSDDLYVTVLPPPIDFTGTTFPTCNTGTSGAISINVTNGTPPYTYTWSNSATTEDISGLAAGTYTVTVRDSRFVTKSLSFTVTSTTAPPATPASITGSTAGLCSEGIPSAVYKASVSGASSYNWTVPANTSIISGQGTNTITLGFNAGFVSDTLSVVAVNACGNSAPRKLGLRSRPAKPGAITGNNTTCPSTTLYYSITAVTSATSYHWLAPANAVIDSGQGGTKVKVSFAGAFNGGDIQVAAINACGVGDTQTKTISVSTILPMPGTISGSATACSNSSGNYSIAAVSGSSSYTWTAPSGASISSGQGSTSVTVSFGPSFSAGNLSVVANSGCGSSAARVKSISPNSLPTPGSIEGMTRVCAGGSEVYTVSSVPGATGYQWSVPANASITAGNGTTTVTVSFSGAFISGNLSVYATSSCGASLPRSLSISAGSPGTPAISGPRYGLCPSGTSSGTYTCTSVAGATSYTWLPPAGTSITSGQGTNSIVLSFGAGFVSGSLSVTANSPCGSSNSPAIALYSTPPKATKMYGTFAVCPNVNTAYSTVTMPGATSYAWTVPSGWTITSGNGTTAINVLTGVSGGTITLTTNNACGSSQVLVKAVSILTGCSSKTESETLEEETLLPLKDMLNEEEVKVFPNPFRDKFSVEFTSVEEESAELLVFDVCGRLVYKSTTTVNKGKNKEEIDLSNSVPGVYLLSLQQGEVVTRMKLVKE